MELDCRQIVDGSEYIYIIPGNPIPLARPRLSKNGVWDSQKHIKFDIGVYLKFLHKNNPLFVGPLHLIITFFMNPPKKNKNIWHITRPDLDNMVKFYMDVANGILYEDDSMVARITATKMYHAESRTEIIIEKL